MGRDRQDRTTEEWATFGHHLLDMMGKKHKLHKEISGLITKLTVPADDINKDEVTHTLNSHKYELKSLWRKWTQKIKQTPKDKERTKFYIKNSTYEKILKYLGLTPDNRKTKNTSDNGIFEILLTHLDGYGISNTKEMYDLKDELKIYGSATSERYSKDDLTSENKGYQGETNKIIHAILEELKKNKISNFEKLRKIRSTINKDLKEENESLIKENNELKAKVRELEIKSNLNLI
ncbi:MAG: hypothetical protein DI594_15775 [Shewanella oneidensis]|nr:MAG: hypothetical protein DI594_15775 [Shewanella oneidensis]